MRSHRRNLSGILSLTLLIFSSGCAFMGREAIIYYAFDYPVPQRNSDSGPISGDTLMVYKFLLAPSVDTDSLVISEPGGKETPMLLHQWKDNPADMVTELLLRDLENSGLFRKTVDQMSTARYRYALEGTVRNLQGRVKDEKGKALIEVDVTLIDFNSPVGTRKDLLRKSYRIEAPSVDTRPESIVKALNMAVRELSQEVRKDIGSALKEQAEQAAPSKDQKAPKSAPNRPRGGSGEIGKRLLFGPAVAILVSGPLVMHSFMIAKEPGRQTVV